MVLPGSTARGARPIACMLQSYSRSGTEAARPPEFVEGQGIAACRVGRRGAAAALTRLRAAGREGQNVSAFVALVACLCASCDTFTSASPLAAEADSGESARDGAADADGAPLDGDSVALRPRRVFVTVAAFDGRIVYASTSGMQGPTRRATRRRTMRSWVDGSRRGCRSPGRRRRPASRARCATSTCRAGSWWQRGSRSSPLSDPRRPLTGPRRTSA